ncbi:23S rRNA (uridine(2479)-2'-O)-methyltransferase [Posidoniimonas polymericola]|uniref:23S rRNA (Uridine(2479)-2'-O)-methyltransferase n=1 Tax=Posidoniimonas polymericola TaxID=2528002 RepID=A0A5C5YEJ4_9BACT|nr:RNA methyltransferase [Posidoniimonas polymericola]TWT73464.1 23S rRNA (uridine(2479)-2'-O)-methyltransferase [Posidoniimonas polymericola]
MPPTQITSRHNPRLKEAAALRNRKQRDEHRQTLVYGARESTRALACGADLRTAFVCEELLGEAGRQATAELEARGVEVVGVSPDAFEKLAYGDRLDGVVSIAATSRRTLADLPDLPERPLIAVIEGVEKPGNLGALLRTADGAGADAVVVADPVIDLYNPNAIRASVATVFLDKVVVSTAAECIDWLRQSGVAVFATRPDATESCWQADLSGAAAIVLGAEATGLTDAWHTAGARPVSLPMLGVGDSLNVSVTAAVLLYEARRQRGASRRH